MTKRIVRSPGSAKLTDSTLVGSVELPTYTVATLPTAASYTGRLVRCSNGNSGADCLAVSNGTNWLRVVYGAAVAAS